MPAARSDARPVPIGGHPLTSSVSRFSSAVTGFEFSRTDTQAIVNIAANVLFNFDLGRCPRERPKNSRAARLIHEGGDGVVTVIEHTNAKKENVHNGKLLFPTVRRVVVWLSGPGGVPGNRLKPDGYSEAEPGSPNSTSDGQDDNVLMCRCGPRSSGAFECPSRAAGFRQA